MRVVKVVLAVVVAASLALGGFLAVTVKRPAWRPLVKRGPPSTLVITNVRVFTATDAGTLEAQQVTLADGRIRALAPRGEPLPTGAEVLDGTGRTLLPGLVDAHTHLANTPAPPWYLAVPDAAHNLEAYLYAGVTTVVSMGDDLKHIGALADRVEQGALAGPRVLYAGSPVTRTGGHPEASKRALVPRLLWPVTPDFAAELDTPEEADAVVERAARGGAAFIKLVVDDLPGGMPRLEPAHVAAITAAAHRRGLKAAAHVGTGDDAVLAVRSGADLLNHAPHRGPLTDAQVQVLADAGVPVIPTLVVFERCAQFGEGHLDFSPLDRAVEAPAIVEQLSDEVLKAHEVTPFLAPWLREVAASRPHRAATVKALYEAGVPLFVGTDSSILGNFAGASMHRELRMLVSAGVPPAQALLGATALPARFFAKDPDFGTIEPGKRADLLLVDGNPLEDIGATERIVEVIQDGRRIERLAPR